MFYGHIMTNAMDVEAKGERTKVLSVLSLKKQLEEESLSVRLRRVCVI